MVQSEGVSKVLPQQTEDCRRGDVGDQASAQGEYEKEVRISTVLRSTSFQEKEFKKRQALGIENMCSDCGENIPEKRRTAMPTAIRCITCEETHTGS